MNEACPSADELIQLVQGTLGASRAPEVREHLDACEDCLATVCVIAAQLDRDDSDGARSLSREPGDVVAGRYRLERVVGVGGMGLVFVATDLELEREVALKVIRPDRHDMAANARLVRESKALARLRHPNVVRVYDAGQVDDETFVAMELIEGQNLRRWSALRERRPHEILAVLVEAARGLAAAHERGLVHRDFKPDNVLVGDDGRVFVGDFGLAQSGVSPPKPSVESDEGEPWVTQSGAVVGTPAYLAPEQREGHATAASDVFSFCVTAYEALQGHRPFEGTTLAAIQLRVREGPPKLRVPGLPRRAARMIERGLMAQPQLRPSLDQLIDQLCAPARRPWAAAVALLGGAATVALVLHSRAPEPPTPHHPFCEDPLDIAKVRAVVQSRASEFEDTEVLFETVEDWIEDWTDRRAALCRRPTPSPVLVQDVGIRLQCLEYRESMALTILERLEPGEPDPVGIARRLPTLEECEDPSLAVHWPMPPEPEVQRTLTELWAASFDLNARVQSGGDENVLVELSALEERCEQLGRPAIPVLTETLYTHASWLTLQGRNTEARTLLLRAAKLGEQIGYTKVAVFVWSSLAYTAIEDLHDYERAEEYVGMAWSALDKMRDSALAPEFRVHLLYHEGLLRLRQNRLEEAEEVLVRALEEAPSADPTLVGHLYALLGSVQGERGELQAALATTKKSLALHLDQVGPDHVYSGYDQLSVGGLLLQLGRYDEANEVYAEAVRALAASHDGEAPIVATAESMVALAQIRRGRFDEAEDALARARRAAGDEAETAMSRAERLPVELELRLEQERYEHALKVADAYVDAARELDPKAQGRLWSAWSLQVVASVASGRRDHARRFLERLHDARDDLQLSLDDSLALAQAEVEALLALGRSEDASARAQALFDDPRFRQYASDVVDELRSAVDRG